MMYDKYINILVIRLSSIGDIIFCLPFILALRNTYPNSKITWLVEKKYTKLISNDPCIDSIIEWERDEWEKLLKSRKFSNVLGRIYQFKKMLKKQSFDMVIDLQGLLKTNLMSWFTGANTRVSLGSEFGGFFFNTVLIGRDSNTKRISSEYLTLAKKLNLKKTNLMSWFTGANTRVSLGSEFGGFFFNTVLIGRDSNTKRISSEYLTLAKKLNLNFSEFRPRYTLPFKKKLKKCENKSYFVIAPFTTRPQKHWDNSYWETLVSNLVQKYKSTCYILGARLNKKQYMLVDLLKKIAVPLIDKTDLMETSIIINDAQFLIGVDTGLTHMSVSLNKPTVAIFGSTCPYLDPINLNSKVIWLGMQCSPCKRNPTCDGAYTCLKQIYPEQVINEVSKII